MEKPLNSLVEMFSYWVLLKEIKVREITSICAFTSLIFFCSLLHEIYFYKHYCPWIDFPLSFWIWFCLKNHNYVSYQGWLTLNTMLISQSCFVKGIPSILILKCDLQKKNHLLYFIDKCFELILWPGYYARHS